MADTTSLHLRLPKKLYKRLQQQARRNNVSLNTEIVNQLEGYETATVKRTTEIVQPLLDEAVRASATIAAEAAVRAVFRERQEAAKERREGGTQMGAPVKRWEVIPLNNPIPETPEPKVPLPEKKTEAESETVKSEGAEQK
jgi:hypothetical protein